MVSGGEGVEGHVESLNYFEYSYFQNVRRGEGPFQLHL